MDAGSAYAATNANLIARGLLGEGTLVDATLIAAPPTGGLRANCASTARRSDDNYA